MRNQIAGLVVIAGLTSSALAIDPIVTEEFVSDSAMWFNAPGTMPLAWTATGGPDGAGDGYASSQFNFVATPGTSDGVVLFRGQDEFGSSGGIFEGDYITAGATQISAMVRHDAPGALPFFVRFATPINFPGVTIENATVVQPNTWTQVVFDIDPLNPFVTPEGGPGTYEAVFGAVGHVQFAAAITDDIAMLDQLVTFDIDNITVIPAPMSVALFGIAAIAMRRRHN